jgi:hypothetical protein
MAHRKTTSERGSRRTLKGFAMRSTHTLRTGLRTLCAISLSALSFLGLTGCLPAPTATTDSSENPLPAVLGYSSTDRPIAAGKHAEAEPNNDFAQAEPLQAGAALDITGVIAGGTDPVDLDLFDLGPAEPGDRFKADLTVTLSSDISLGLLDDRQRLIAYLDPYSPTTGPAHLDVIIRQPTTHLYLALGAGVTAASDRPYTVHLTHETGQPIPDYRPQIIVLNFNGGSGVRIGTRKAVDVPAFDAAVIGPRYAGQTARIVQDVLARVSDDYAGLGFSVYLAGDPNIPDGQASTIYFGTYDPNLLGLADNIDPYNATPEQDAVVFTDTFSLFNALSPDVTAMSQCLANVASHEIGHLVGLRHTADSRDLMDTTATARQMMVDQWFRAAPVNESVFPVGYQDAPLMLSWTLGGVLGEPPSGKQIAARERAIEVASGGADFYVPRWQLMSCHCPGCTPPPSADPAGLQ